MRRTTALVATALALCAVLLGGCRRGADRTGARPADQPGTVQTGGSSHTTGDPGATDPGTVSTEVSSDLDDIDALLTQLDAEQTKANQPFPDAD